MAIIQTDIQLPIIRREIRNLVIQGYSIHDMRIIFPSSGDIAILMGLIDYRTMTQCRKSGKRIVTELVFDGVICEVNPRFSRWVVVAKPPKR